VTHYTSASAAAKLAGFEAAAMAKLFRFLS